MASFNVPAPPPLNMTDDRNLSQNWTKFYQRFQNFEIATGINEKGDVTRIATLLSVIGQDAVDTFNTFKFATESDKKKFDKVKEQFENYCKGKKNTTYERYVFNNRFPEEGESFDAYVTALKRLADTCEFGELKDSLIKDRIILGIKDRSTKQRLLRTDDLTLDKAVTIVRTATAASVQLDYMNSNSQPSHVNALSKSRRQGQWSRKTKFNPHAKKSNAAPNPHAKNSGSKSKQKECRNCGGDYPHPGDKACPALGKMCNYCKKKNHFAKKCRAKRRAQANALNTDNQHDQSEDHQESDSSEDYAYVLGNNSPETSAKQPRVPITVNGEKLTVIVDSGATVNVMTKQQFDNLAIKPELQPSTFKIFAYGAKKELQVYGKIPVVVDCNNTHIDTEFHVVKAGGVKHPLLSYSSAKRLKIIEIHVLKSVDTSNMSVDEIIQSYDDRFIGLGKLSDAKCKLHADDNIQPVTQPHRRIPFPVRKKVETELDRLKNLDVIEEVSNTPTPWISPIRVVPKPKRPGEIRLCIDMRAPNRAIQRERHVTPTIDDIIANLNGATVFSTLDLKNGYHQVELDEDSRYLTVFSTHIGLYRFRRLNFGVNSAAEQFQNLIQSALAGLPGVMNISDDIIVFGKDEQEHKERLAKCLQRLREKNLTINRSKCQFSKDSVEFFGHRFSAAGVSPATDKVEGLQNAAPPTCKDEVRSFLGLATYCSRFIPRLATVSEPLRQVTKDSAPWKWGKKQDSALKQIKDLITEHCTTAYYNVDAQTEVVVDASPVGLCAMLVQHDKTTGASSLVALASRSLTDVEQRYSQTEREASAVTWGCLHFHLYLYGSKFTIVTDHKPLVPLYNKVHSKPSARLENLILKLQQYTYEVVYRPGKNNPADYLSRHPLPTTASEMDTEEHVNFVLTNAIAESVSLKDIEEAVKTDETSQSCKKAHLTNTWHKEIAKATGNVKTELVQLHPMKDEISVTSSGIILRGNRIVIPQSLRQSVINIAHEGHLGVVKTKQLIRQKIWFPGIDKRVEETIAKCIPCQATHVEHSSEELHMSELPAAPWTELSADFKEIGQNKGYLLVFIDDFSRFPVVEPVTSTSAKAVIPKLDKIFSTFGIPQVLRTDNGPPFNSEEFANFAQYMGFTHRKIMPRWPQANGIAERLMRSLKKVYQTAHAEHKSSQQALNQFLRNYRATAHPTTGKSPSSLLLQHEARTRLPEVPA